MVGALRFAFLRGRLPKRLAAVFTGALLLASCGSTCLMNCRAPAAEVDVSRLPTKWLQRATFRLCADGSCTTSALKAGATTIQTPNLEATTPKQISLTVTLDKQVVLSATSRGRFEPSSGGDCTCGGNIGVRVDTAGKFTRL